MYKLGDFGRQSLNLGEVSLLPKVTLGNLHTFALQKNKFFPVNTGGVS